MLILCMLLFVFGGMNVWGAEEVIYTLEPASGSNNNYASNCDVTISSITWNITGNSTTQPWRIGGKSISNVDRTVYSKTAISDNVTKIEVIHGAASSITVNSMTVIVSKNSDFSSPVSTLTQSFAANKTVTINRPDGKDWSKCYYKIVYNVTVSGSSNKFVEFTRAKFYTEATPAIPFTITLMDDSQQLTEASAGSGVTLPSRAGCVGYTFAGWTKTWVTDQTSWTTTAPTIIPAGSYTPSADENLYPVYTKTESGGGPSNDYELYSGSLTEGDYIMYYDGKAMNTTVSGDRLQYEEVTPDEDIITTTDESIIWHISASGDYWTIYNAAAEKYAASTGAKNKAQMLADGTDDKSLWTVSGTSTYEFVNKQNTTNSVNANLRNNGTYGFACYSKDTGGALSLYKNVSGGSTTSYISVPNCCTPLAQVEGSANLSQWNAGVHVY